MYAHGIGLRSIVSLHGSTADRTVRVDALEAGMAFFRGVKVPVEYITGTDIHTHQRVRWTQVPRIRKV